MELGPHQTQTLELENSFASEVMSALAGVLPSKGGSEEDVMDTNKLHPLVESPYSGRPTRRLSATTSARPTNILSHSYPPRQSVSVVTLPDSSSVTSSLPESKTVEVRHVPQEVRSKRQLWWSRLYFFTLCFSSFLGGWNDSATGPLLPTFQKYYHIGFTVVSMVFIASTVGFVLAGLILNVGMVERMSYGKVMLAASFFQIVGYSIQTLAPPFSIMAVAYGINGFGWCIQNAKATSYICSVPKHSVKLGLLYAFYGIGSLTVPLVSTQFAQRERWSFHFFSALGLAVVNSVLIGTVFRLRDEETLHKLAGDASFPADVDTNDKKKFNRMMGLKETHLFAMWTFLYVGIEVSIGGWINTFLIDYRGGNSKTTGYAVTGFWTGFTVGRLAFLWVNRKIGERRAVHIYLAICICLQFTVWFAPSLVGNAVAVAAIGLFMGPMYPIMMRQTGRVLPRVLLQGAIAWISSMGVTGSAILPFITGALASKFGIGSLQPFILSMMGLMGACWMLIPQASLRRIE